MRNLLLLILFSICTCAIAICANNALIVNVGREAISSDSLQSAMSQQIQTNLYPSPKIAPCEMHQAIQSAAESATGTLFIYILGYGFVRNGTEYILLEKAQCGNDTLSIDSIMRFTSKITTRPVLFITSIIAIRPEIVDPKLPLWKASNIIPKSERRFVYIRAGGLHCMSAAFDNGFDVFTYYLCQLLRDNNLQNALDKDHDHLLLLEDVFDFLFEKTKSTIAHLSNGERNGSPHLHRISGRIDTSLIFWKVKKAEIPAYAKACPAISPTKNTQKILLESDLNGQHTRMKGKRSWKEPQYQTVNDLGFWVELSRKKYALLLVYDSRSGECEKMKTELVSSPYVSNYLNHEGQIQLIFINADTPLAELDKIILDNNNLPFGTQGREFLRNHIARNLAQTPSLFLLHKSDAKITDIHLLPGYHKPETIHTFIQNNL
jgi:hypothetical protein